jgi:hypothetical protein
MGSAVYNSAILNMVNRAIRSTLGARVARQIPVIVFAVIFGATVGSSAADWNGPEQQLARKIVAVTGPGAVALTVENRSSLGRRDSDIIGNGLRAALEGVGIRFVAPEQAAASVAISLSENARAYVWVAEIHQSTGEATVVMVSVPHATGAAVAHDSVPLSLRRTPLWAQEDRILDVAVLEEGSAPTHIAVLDGERVGLYRMQGGKWQLEQSLSLSHARPWPRDLRGRLVPARDHLLDVYLPGVLCHTTSGMPLTLNCRESDDPWPLVMGALLGSTKGSATSANFPSFGSSTLTTSPTTSSSVGAMGGFFAPTRNFFTGALVPGVGKITTVPKFFSAAFLPRDKYVLWLFAAVDGKTHMVDGVSDLTGKLGWGSDLASVKTSCGVGWQVLAAGIGDQDGDSVRAYEFPDRDPVPVSVAVDFPGEVTALWTEAKGDTAILIARSAETGNYEAFRLSVACNQ